MATSSASTGNRSTLRSSPPFGIHLLSGRTGSWPVLIGAAAAGPMAATEIALLSKPLGGATGLPGAVVGYTGLTALALAAATVLPAWRWRLAATGRRAGFAAIIAGLGLLVAAVVPAVGAFTAGLLATGIGAGPLLLAARAATRARAFHVAMSAGALAGALAAALLVEHPRLAVLTAASVAVAAGLVAAVADPGLDAGFDGGIRACTRRLGRYSSTYGALGFAVGATVLPALHLLLFRWNVLDADQPAYLAAALVPAPLAATLTGYGRPAPALSLILAAGGLLLVATAPGAWQTALGVAVTVTAAVRATAVTDSTLREQIPEGQRVCWAAVTGTALALGGFGGLAATAGLARVWGTGSALTLLAIVVLAAAVVSLRPSAAGHSGVDPTTTQQLSDEGEAR